MTGDKYDEKARAICQSAGHDEPEGEIWDCPTCKQFAKALRDQDAATSKTIEALQEEITRLKREHQQEIREMGRECRDAYRQGQSDERWKGEEGRK